MNPARWPQIQALFHRAKQQTPEERDQWLVGVDAEEEDRTAVQELLAAASQGDTFLEDLFGPPGQEDSQAPLPPRIGPYRTLRELGRGGAGAVFLALRDDEQFRKRVALKILRGEALGRTAEARFRRERQILAALEHPSIARLLDGGTTDWGTPYLVLEYVEGEPIDRFCEQGGLSVDERLEILLRVCDAVQYAHQNLVLHCDLKPANLLVTTEGQPKLLDFGIAGLLNPELTATEPAIGDPTQRPLTPAFASPEQVDGRPLTTASDVYALGALLYHLLVGRPPLDLEGLPRAEVERILAAETPPKASEAAHNPQLRRRLRGDLDAILEKALGKDPASRYGSVEALAADLRRHRKHLPVAARPPGWRYRGLRFARRYRGLVATIAVLMLLGAALAIQSGRLAAARERVAQERDQARLQGERAEEVSTFLLNLFEAADPARTTGGEPTVRDILERGAGRIESELRDQPRLQARLHETVGSAYQKLGQFEAAAQALQRTLDLHREQYPQDHPEIARGLESYASLLCEQGRGREAIPLLDQALAVRRRQGGVPLARTLGQSALLHLDLGWPEAAEQALTEALDLYRNAGGQRQPAVADTLVALGKVAQHRGDLVRAEDLSRQGIALRRELPGPGHPQLTRDLNQLAVILHHQGKFEAAEDHYREALTIRENFLPEDHPDLAESLHNLASLASSTGKPETAEELHREALTILESAFGNTHPRIGAVLNNLAGALMAQGHLDEAAKALERSVHVRRDHYGEAHPEVAMGWNNLAVLNRERNALIAAEQYSFRAVEVARKVQGPEHPFTAAFENNRATVLAALGRTAEAETAMRRVLEQRRRTLDPDHLFFADSFLSLGQLLVEMERAEEAEPLLRRALEMRSRAFPANHWKVGEASSALGASLLALGRKEEAAPLLRSGLKILRATRGDGARSTQIAARRLARLMP